MKTKSLTYAEIVERNKNNKPNSAYLAPVGAKGKGAKYGSYKFTFFHNFLYDRAVKNVIKANEHSIDSVCCKCGTFISLAANREQFNKRRSNRLCRCCLSTEKND